MLLAHVGFANGDEFVQVTQVNVHSAKGVIKRPVRKRPCVKFDPTDDRKNPDYQTIRDRMEDNYRSDLSRAHG